jgi:sugar lactone lactonase YvrE
VDPYGSIYVADADNFRIRKITPDGVVSTVAGAGRPGYRDGAADRALFGYPTGIAVYGEAVYVADRRTHTVRKIEDGKVSTIAGVGVAGYADGAAAKSRLREPIALSVDSSGVYISDSGNNAIRKIEGGVIRTVAGGKRRGYRDGVGQEAMFFWPTGIAVDSTGVVYVCDSGNNKMRRITPDGVVSTVAGGLVAGRSDGPGFTASFNFPTGIAVDDKQGIFVADSGNNMIRRIRVEGSAVSARPEQ